MSIKTEAVIAEVRNLARQKPDFIYTDQEGVPYRVGGSCSYLAATDDIGFSILQDVGKFPQDLSYDEARQRGLLGQRCIVGQALSNLGVSDETLKEHEGVGAKFLAGRLLEGVKAKESQLLWLESVQAEQDSGETWGEAVQIANSEYPRV